MRKLVYPIAIGFVLRALYGFRYGGDLTDETVSEKNL